MSNMNRTRVWVDANTLSAANVKAVELADLDTGPRDGLGIVISTHTGDVVVTGNSGSLVGFAHAVLGAAFEILEMGD